MKKDNKDHKGVCCEKVDGGFAVFDTLKKAESSPIEFTGNYQDVVYNWNKGKPRVNFGFFEMALKDVK